MKNVFAGFSNLDVLKIEVSKQSKSHIWNVLTLSMEFEPYRL